MDSAPESKKRPAQFGIGRLMVITVLVAVIMAISVRMYAPRLAQGLLAGYLFFFAIWIVIRGPSILADLSEVNRKRMLLKQRRGDLEREYNWRMKNRDEHAKGSEALSSQEQRLQGEFKTINEEKEG